MVGSICCSMCLWLPRCPGRCLQGSLADAVCHRCLTGARLQGLNNNQLAVFFRNNHFNLLHKRDGALYILVTDQGYLYEQVSTRP